MCKPHRREFLRRAATGGLLLTPLASLLTSCRKPGWPDGMVEIKWDRDTCERCNMVISDRRFAAEISGGPRGTAFKFDDIGCLLFWMRDKLRAHPWMGEKDAQLWVADANSSREQLNWLEPRSAHYVVKTSPMGYNFAAVGLTQTDSVAFEEMRRQVLAKGK